MLLALSRINLSEILWLDFINSSLYTVLPEVLL